ncbi:TetR/AcrR family transcriptional regulator [Rhodococcus fascians]|nr:TetR/AcrR family transcriptional regulator [Rhodococcus fascians]MBY3998500.1 TetR/AcrR family transcriptional regulator [Rhodococcus fascians]MBY4004506.1 TetR/AcrR family transcriptional regulator [Rhodococcus fascians]MBY4009313.1 TetR/AcrR family transcriptional regulator [Rhodococcus fascians]MBY4019713.1 TetR/AcrR family transcriptional regulator [Rhodococcus fascians]
MAPAGRPRAFDASGALDAAIDVFWRRGFESASLAELTQAMGINRPSLYAAFGDKAQLFTAALDRYIDSNMGYVGEALAQPTARECAQAFLVGNAHAVTMPGRPAGCLSVQAVVTSEGSAEFAVLAENRAVIEKRFADRFRRAITEGDLPAEENPEELAAVLITVASGFAIRAADGTPRSALVALAQRTMELFPIGNRAAHR